MGAQSRFGRGDVQWMTAGKGVVHSEMFPLVDAKAPNRNELFQVWLNLPAANKMVDPYFTMIWSEEIQRHRETDANGHHTTIAVVAGQYQQAKGVRTPPDSWAAKPDHQVNIWTSEMDAHAKWVLPAGAKGTTRVLYVYDHRGCSVAGQLLNAPTGVQLFSEQPVAVENGDHPAQLLLLEGQPIREPVAQHGPFVMNHRAEIEQAFADYRRTRFGGWPWGSDDPVMERERGRFAKHADGRLEEPA